ncbi:MAG: glycosyltransferase family 4 protein [Leadbetterella sp.]
MNFIFENLIDSTFTKVSISMILAFVVTYVATPVIINICNLKGLMEDPIKRSSHELPTPTFGGVAIFSSVLLGYMIWNFDDEGYMMHKVFFGITLLFFTGIKDDLFALDALKKLAAQIFVALVVVVGADLRITSFFGIFGIQQIPYFFSIIFSIFLIVALINSFNLIDGVDGLSGGIGMIASGGFGLWYLLNEQYSLACLAFSLVGSLAAFLRFNFSTKNKIFMGDTGSLIIGFIVAILAIQFVQLHVHTSNRSGVFKNAPVIAIVLLCVPIFDTLRVFSIRIFSGKSPFKADRLHLHHLMVDNGLSHVSTSTILYLVTLVFTTITYGLRTFFTNTTISIGVLGVFFMYLGVCRYLEIRRVRIHKIKLTESFVKQNGELEFAEVNKN